MIPYRRFAMEELGMGMLVHADDERSAVDYRGLSKSEVLDELARMERKIDSLLLKCDEIERMIEDREG